MAVNRLDAAKFAQMMFALATATRCEIDEPTIELYFRALAHVPMALLEQASIELAATAKFMPKPAEWLEAVDELLDRRRRLQAIGGPSNQLRLPGEVGVFLCDDCDNTGFVTRDIACEKGRRCGLYRDGGHTHSQASRCVNRFCVERRAQVAEQTRRYARSK